MMHMAFRREYSLRKRVVRSPTSKGRPRFCPFYILPGRLGADATCETRRRFLHESAILSEGKLRPMACHRSKNLPPIKIHSC